MPDLDSLFRRRSDPEAPPPDCSLGALESPDPLFDAFEDEAPRRPGTSFARGAARRGSGRRPTNGAGAGFARGSLALWFLALACATTSCGREETAPIAGDAILVQLRDGVALPQWTRADEREASAAIVPLAAAENSDGLDDRATADADGAPDVRGSSDARGPLLRIPLLPGEEPRALAAELARDPAVAFAEPIAIYRPFAATRTPDDPRFRDQWGLAAIDAPTAWASTVGDRAVVVAVVDNGIALAHPDLQPNLWTNPGELAGNGLDDDGDGIADDVHGASFLRGVASGDPSARDSNGPLPWHGTHAAGAIGAEGGNRIGVAGVAWRVSLMGVRAMDASGGRSDDLARAIDYASAHGARVIHAGWGGVAASEAVEQAIVRAGQRGALFVAAAGNDGAPSPAFPANVGADNLISVGALDPSGGLAAFSNRGALVAAPGVGILSTTSPGSYEREDGTSAAAALVSGLAALLFAAAPHATVAQVRAAIVASSQATATRPSGRIDAGRALAALEGMVHEPAALVLSRGSLAFASASGESPRAQTISVRAKSGAVLDFTASSSAPWLKLVHTRFATPARVTVYVDPSGLASGVHAGAIAFAASDGATGALEVSLQVGAAPRATVLGDSCALDEGGAVHVRRGGLCAIAAPGFREDASAPQVAWRLPDGSEAHGARLTALFPRRGRFVIELRGAGELRDTGEPQALAVEVE